MDEIYIYVLSLEKLEMCDIFQYLEFDAVFSTHHIYKTILLAETNGLTSLSLCLRSYCQSYKNVYLKATSLRKFKGFFSTYDFSLTHVHTIS